MIALLLLVALGGPPARVSPAAPTVGDPIAIRFPEERAKITLEESDAYEIVKSGASPAVIRAFRPGPIAVRGRLESANGSFRFRDLRIEVRSVLAEDDSLEPAPFRPPREIPPNRVAWWAIGFAALAAVALWTAVWRMRDAVAPLAASAAASFAAGSDRVSGRAPTRPLARAPSLARSDRRRDAAIPLSRPSLLEPRPHEPRAPERAEAAPRP